MTVVHLPTMQLNRFIYGTRYNLDGHHAVTASDQPDLMNMDAPTSMPDGSTCSTSFLGTTYIHAGIIWRN